jgi:formylglycine-generating enzyme required for sulfatase activity
MKGVLILALAGLVGCITPHYSGYCPDGMVLVPPGKFRYGDEEVTGRRTGEEIGAFCIDRYEYPNREGARPTAGVSWIEAAAICRGKGKRLCTEYEWEKAARGPRGQRYPWGNIFDPSACALDPGAPGEHLAGARPRCRSYYGVYDMGGSVWEWVQNKWQDDAAAPDAGGTERRVVRGGWERGLGERGARASYRAAEDASKASPRIGFRCCAPAVSGLYTTRDNGPGP